MANPYFNAEYYLFTNQDVYNAGVTLAGAEQHYQLFGAAEGRKPAPWFDAQYYVQQNPDLLALEVNQLFDHFANYGLAEGRAPSAEAQITEAGLLAYANANEDLRTAFGIEAGATELTEAQALGLTQQFYAFGYTEDRDAAPFDASVDPVDPGSVFTLTNGIDFADTASSLRNGTATSPGIPSDFKFTNGNETVEAVRAAFLGATDTLIDGSTADNDKLRVTLDAATGAATIRNIELFEVRATNTAAAALDLTNVTGLKTVTIAGTPGGNLSVTGIAATTGLTSIDASGVSTNVTFTANASASVVDVTLIGAVLGANTLTGGLGHDAITGGAGADTIVDMTGNNTISSGAGADTITTGAGNDTIDGGAGNDTINAGAGNNVVSGGAGNDTITTAAGNDTIDGGEGNDTINAGAGNNVVNGGAGNDNITVGAGNDTVTGGAGNDTITLSTGNDVVILEASATANGNDIVGGFTAGAINTTVGGDVLNVSAFTGGIQEFMNVATGADVNAVNSNLVVINDGLFSSFNVVARGAAPTGGDDIMLKESANIVVVELNGANSIVRYVTTDANGTVVSDAQVVELTGTVATALIEANFA